MDIWIVSSFGQLQIKVVWKSLFRFFVNICLHFLCINTQKWNCWVIWKVHVYLTLNRNCLRGYFILSYHLQQMRVSVVLCPHQHLILSVFWAILISVWWYLTEIFICISLMTNDTGHVLCANLPWVCLNCLFGSFVFCPFVCWVVCFLIIELWEFFIYSGYQTCVCVCICPV